MPAKGHRPPEPVIKARRRDGKPVQRVEIRRAECQRCHRETHLVNGEVAYHLRPSTPDDDNFSPDFPSMTECRPGDAA